MLLYLVDISFTKIILLKLNKNYSQKQGGSLYWILFKNLLKLDILQIYLQNNKLPNI